MRSTPTQATYQRIAEAIRERWIHGPGAHVGARLPTERVLQETYGVSRDTITRALAQLKAEGVIETRRGSGAYVCQSHESAASAPLVGFIAPQLPYESHTTHAFGLRLYQGIEHKAQELGYQVLAACSHFDSTHEAALITQFARLGVEAVILQPVQYPTPRLLQDAPRDPLAVRWRELPIVLCDLGFESWKRPRALFDNEALAYQITEALLALGRRNIAFLHSHPGHLHTSLQDRAEGWARALETHGEGVPCAYRTFPAHFPGYQHRLTDADADMLVEELLALVPRPDALLAWEDGTAMALIRALERRGVSVPSELLVVGFDNLEAGRTFEPAFPTSDPDWFALGEAALEQVRQQRSATTAATRHLPVEILWRGAL